MNFSFPKNDNFICYMRIDSAFTADEDAYVKAPKELMAKLKEFWGGGYKDDFDLNQDGKINILDFLTLSSNYSSVGITEINLDDLQEEQEYSSAWEVSLPEGFKMVNKNDANDTLDVEFVVNGFLHKTQFDEEDDDTMESCRLEIPSSVGTVNYFFIRKDVAEKVVTRTRTRR